MIIAYILDKENSILTRLTLNKKVQILQYEDMYLYFSKATHIMCNIRLLNIKCTWTALGTISKKGKLQASVGLVVR